MAAPTRRAAPVTRTDLSFRSCMWASVASRVGRIADFTQMGEDARPMLHPQMPVPDSNALAASRALTERICNQIATRGGWLPFDDYMRLALYEPSLGYYTGGAEKFGAAGDFVTAPSLGPLF